MSNTPIHSLADLASAARNDHALNDTLMEEVVTYSVQTLREYLGTNSSGSLNELTSTALSHHAMQLRGEFAPNADNFTVTHESKDEVFHMAEEYWQERYQRFREWAIATHKREAPPETALNPDDMTGEDLAGLMLFGAPHPQEVHYLICNTPKAEALESKFNRAFAMYYGYENFVQACARIRPEYELGRMPEHLIKMIQRGETDYTELERNSMHLTGEIQNHNQSDNQFRIDTLSRLSPYHPSSTYTGGTPIFSRLLAAGWDEEAQRLLKAGHVEPMNFEDDFNCCQFAVRGASTETIQAMLDAGFDFQTNGQKHEAASEPDNLINEALSAGRYDVAALLARSGVNAIAIVGAGTRTPLMQWMFAELNQPKAIADALIAMLEQGAGQLFQENETRLLLRDHLSNDQLIEDLTANISADDTTPSERENIINEKIIFDEALKYINKLEARFKQFSANAEALRDPYGDGGLPYSASPSPQNLTRKDVIDFYTIGKLPEMMDSRYWVYHQDRLDALLQDEEAPLPKHIANEIRELRQPNTAELARTAPQKPFESWASAVSQPQPERARA